MTAAVARSRKQSVVLSKLQGFDRRHHGDGAARKFVVAVDWTAITGRVSCYLSPSSGLVRFVHESAYVRRKYTARRESNDDSRG